MIDYLNSLATVPVHQRAPELGPGLSRGLLPLMLRLAQFPEGFTSWAECVEDDEEAFYRFRCTQPQSQSLKDISSESSPSSEMTEVKRFVGSIATL